MNLQRKIKNLISKKNSGCWEWQGTFFYDGRYGRVWDENSGKSKLAHRASYETFVGGIPKGMCVCHKCDNTSCVNPSHLFLGTNAQNSKDMVLKQRSARGEKNCKARLKTSDVQEIRSLYKTGGYTYQTLGKKYGVCYTVIAKIIKREIWKHV